MYTRCPQCKTVHPLSAAQVSKARGLVKCGHCHHGFNALNFLSDDWPSGRAYDPEPDANTVPPLLGRARKPADNSNTALPPLDIPAVTGGKRRIVWGLAAALLVVLTVVHSAWTFREPLMGIPVVNNWLKQSGWLQVEQDGLLKDPQQMQLVSRDMHTHPTRSGILVLSLTFVNLAQRSQVYPDLQLTLLDAANQSIARRRLAPADYLRPGAQIQSGLATEVYLPVLLEFGDPGEQAVGFEIQFL